MRFPTNLPKVINRVLHIIWKLSYFLLSLHMKRIDTRRKFDSLYKNPCQDTEILYSSKEISHKNPNQPKGKTKNLFMESDVLVNLSVKDKRK